ncbi:YdeI/OmpD-associated family protein [Pseudokineococcus sp. 1T1Z-3]|uniref:YdeI/OmpD-associated family protein n=1 Tax=Pseudokineococcus sp. 1T1Z-3 TaxID=3132745 RepID=UPI0030B430A8
MRPRGREEVDRAQADGRWDRAYAGPAAMEVPDDLRAALDADATLAAVFAGLGAQDRYSACWRVSTATSPAVRARRLEAAPVSLALVGACDSAQ